MLKRTPTLTVLALSTLAATAWIASPEQQEGIEGTWIATSEDNSNQRGLFLFTSDGSYSMMYVRGDEPRAEPNENWTESDRLASFNEITANSGRVSVEGNEINYEAYMANSTAYMNGWPDNDQTATFEMDGNMMRLTLGNGQSFLLRRPNG